jgi:hypothetical protein
VVQGCIDTTSDPLNCGGCGLGCQDGAICIDSICTCPGTQVTCDGACTDTTSDAANCGGCGLSCPGLEGATACVDSSCTCLGTSCTGTCTDTTRDPANCGECGIACEAGDSCTNSFCAGHRTVFVTSYLTSGDFGGVPTVPPRPTTIATPTWQAANPKAVTRYLLSPLTPPATRTIDP